MTLMGIVRITLTTFLLAGFGAATVQADTIYISIKGMKQGPFKGEILQEGIKGGRFAGLKFSFDAMSPHGPTSGMATGKFQHTPVTITKEWGGASPQLFQALVTNEVLLEIIIDFFGVNPEGNMVLSHSIRLTNASVANISHSTEPIATGGVHHFENVSFLFQKIELVDVLSNTIAMDDRSRTR